MDKILKLLTKINQFFIVSSLPETYFHQFCLNQLCQLVLYEHVKSPNHFKLWLYAGPLKEPLPGGMKTDRLLGPLASWVLVETCSACLYNNQNMDKTASLLRYRNRLIGILPTALVILGLIAEKFSVHNFILPVPSNHSSSGSRMYFLYLPLVSPGCMQISS